MGGKHVKHAVVEMINVFVVEYDRQAALDDFIAAPHVGSTLGRSWHWDARLSDAPPDVRIVNYFGGRDKGKAKKGNGKWIAE